MIKPNSLKFDSAIELTIAMNAWNRFPERFNYFKSSVESLKANLTASKINIYWLVSVEQENHLFKEEFDKFCADNQIQAIYKPYKPNLAANQNLLFDNIKTFLTLYVQDDFILTKPLNIDQEIYFLTHSPEYGMVRYFAANHENPKYLDTYLGYSDLKELSKESHFYYCDGPQLRTKYFTKTLGPYNTKLAPDGNDHSLGEWDMNERAKKSLMPRIAIRIPSDYFGHAGLVSTLSEKWEAHSRICNKS